MSWSRNDSGLKNIDTAEILKEVQDAFKKAFPGISVDPSTPQGQIITYFTENLAKCQADIAYFANIFTNGGSGVWLDIRNQALFGISRKPAVKSTVMAEISGVPGTMIPAGFKAESTDKKIFETVKENIIDPEGKVSAFMIAEDTGDFQILAGTLTSIISQIVGVERITNPQNSSKGIPRESDQEFRARAEKSIHFSSMSVFNGLLAQVMNLNGVEKVGGYENSTDKTVLYKNIETYMEMPPHSINVIVKSGDSDEIAETILCCKNPGCAMGGDERRNLADPLSGQRYEVSFYRSKEAPLFAEVILKTAIEGERNYRKIIYDCVNSYLSGLKFGADIYPFNILAELSGVSTDIVDFKIGRKGGVAGYGFIQLDFIEEAVIAEADIVIKTEQLS